MVPKEKSVSLELNEKTNQIFSDFMTRIAKFEELVSFGSSLLHGFQQGLEMLRRPSIQKTSELIDSVIKANETKRVKAYAEAGFINVHDGVQSISKLNTCQRGLHDHLNKAKSLLNELESSMENIISVIQIENKSFSKSWVNNSRDELLIIEEEMESMNSQKPEVSDYASMMGVVYSMVKQDYTMQEKIISSLNLNSSSGELESYSLMWSLRPFINEEVMHKAWSLIP